MVRQQWECTWCTPHWIVGFKMVKMVNFMLCLFYHNKKVVFDQQRCKMMEYRSVQGGKYWSFPNTKSWRFNMINRLLDSITDSMVTYLRKLQETVEERGIWHAAIHGVEKSQTRLHNCACVLTRFSCVQLFGTLWLIALHAPLSVGFSMQQYWGALPCPPPGDLPTQGSNPCLLRLLHRQTVLYH